MNDNQTKEAIKKVYPTSSWAQRVDKMRPDQATAVYIRLRNQAKL
jgi:hypothetical protein